MAISYIQPEAITEICVKLNLNKLNEKHLETLSSNH